MITGETIKNTARRLGADLCGIAPMERFVEAPLAVPAVQETREVKMDTPAFIQDQVHRYYWEEDLNCATTLLKILAERERLKLEGQVVDAAIGLHGAGGHGAQCGLVEGGLLFLGVWGRSQGWSPGEIVGACHAYAQSFETRFGSLLCRELRPQGFGPGNPPHLCERLTCKAGSFAVDYIETLKTSRA